MKKVYTYRCDPELVELSKRFAKSRNQSLGALIRFLLAASVEGKINIEEVVL